MTREEAGKAAEIMLAYANGEVIERYKDSTGEWEEVGSSCTFNWGVKDYRVKPKGRFDPRTLQPFDKVLVKTSCSNVHCWFADFIATPVADNDTRGCIMSDMDTDMVIPYNDETKHLVGTNKEAPEYYRYWEE